MDTWQPGDWAVVRSHSLIGSGVEWMQKLSGVTDPRRTGWVHAIVGLPGNRIGEAEPGGFKCRPMHYDPQDVFWISGRWPRGEPTEIQRQLIVKAAEDLGYRDVGYSELDYVAIAAHQWHLWAPGLKHFIEASGHMICSQSVDWCCLQAGYHLFRDERWPGFVRPYDLAKLGGAPFLS
jgi:hypothetical protein